MTMVLGTWVPDVAGHPLDHEVCHSFVYRWLIGRGIFRGNYPDPLTELDNLSGRQLLWPTPGGAARHNGVIQVRAGHIVGFWDGPNLTHSMIAITATSWIGTRNQTTFGVQPGRQVIANVNGGFPGALIPNPHLRMGWVGNGNQWRVMGGAIATVTHRLPLPRHF